MAEQSDGQQSDTKRDESHLELSDGRVTEHGTKFDPDTVQTATSEMFHALRKGSPSLQKKETKEGEHFKEGTSKQATESKSSGSQIVAINKASDSKRSGSEKAPTKDSNTISAKKAATKDLKSSVSGKNDTTKASNSQGGDSEKGTSQKIPDPNDTDSVEDATKRTLGSKSCDSERGGTKRVLGSRTPGTDAGKGSQNGLQIQGSSTTSNTNTPTSTGVKGSDSKNQSAGRTKDKKSGGGKKGAHHEAKQDNLNVLGSTGKNAPKTSRGNASQLNAENSKERLASQGTGPLGDRMSQKHEHPSSAGSMSLGDQSKPVAREVVVKLHGLIAPQMWQLDTKRIRVGVVTEKAWKRIVQCLSLRPVDEQICDVTVQLIMTEKEMESEFQYKYYVWEEGKEYGQHEHFGDLYYGYHNRILDRRVNLIYDSKENCFHHYDGCILPKDSTTETSIFSRAYNFFSSKFGQGQSERKAQDALRCHSLLYYLKDYSEELQGSKCVETLSQPNALDMVDRISAVYTQIKDLDLRDASYGQGRRKRDSNEAVPQEFIDWIIGIVMAVNAIPQESPEISAKIKVSGCALVVLLHKTQTVPLLATDMRESLVNMLKYSRSTQDDYVLKCHQHLRVLVPISDDTRFYREQLYSSLKDFWLYVAGADQMHFGILPVLFHIKGCFAPCKTLSVNVFSLLDKQTLERIASRKDKFKRSLTDCLFLMDSSFCPALAELVLPLVSVQVWLDFDLLPRLPLNAVLSYLCAFIEKEKVPNYREKVIKDVGQCMHKLAGSFKESSRRDVSTSTKSAFKIASAVLSADCVDQNVVTATAQLCLWLCSYGTKRDEVDNLLQNMCHDVVRGLVAYVKKKKYVKDEEEKQFGCNSIGYEKYEFQVWSRMLSLKGEASVKRLWIGKCTTSILQRFKLVPSVQRKLSILEYESTVSEDLERILLDEILESFERLNEKAMETLVTGRSRKIRGILYKYLNRKYSQPENIKFEELCSWSLWPHCFKVFSNVSQTGHSSAVENAKVILESVVETIPEKGISVENLRIITLYGQNFEDMTKALFQIKGEGDESASIAKAVQLCQSVLKKFEENVQRLEFLCQQGRKFMTGKGAAECDELQRFCNEDIERLTIAALESRLGASALVTTVQSIYYQFYIVFKTWQNDVTAKLWSEHAIKVDSFECLANNVWPTFYDSLKEKADKLKRMDVSCEEALRLLPPRRVKKDPELKKLVRALDECEGRPPSNCDKWIEQIMHQTRVYSDARRVSEQAQHLLEVKEALQLTGNFDGAKNIAHIEEKLGPMSLSAVSMDDLARNAAFLAHFDKYHTSLILVGKSHDIIEWIKTLGDASQLQTFTNIALITQCEDASSVDRLTSLETVGTKMAPIIFHLPKSAGMFDLMNRCKHIEGGLEKIAEHMETCNKSLEWYKRIQGTLGSVEETAYGQLTDLTEAGKYTIAIPGGKIPEDIKELVQVEIVDKATPKTSYTLEELKDLQSKLALIKGKISKPDFNKKTDTFWQGLELTVRIASCLLDLLLVGHMKYRMFTCTYSLNSAGVVNDMKIRAKEMENDLEDWNNTVDSLRSQHYHLNYFTARQLSVICQELSVYSGRHSPINPWLLNLLESLSPSVVEESVRSAIEDIIAERDQRKLKSFLGTSRDNDVQRGSRTVNAEMEMEEPDEMTATQEQKQELESSPALKVEELTEEQHELFEELLALAFAENHILCGLVECGNDFDAIEDYCLKRSSEDVEEASMEPDISQRTSGLLTTVDKQEKELPIDEDHPTVKGLLNAGFPLLLALEAVKTCPQEDDAFDYCLENEQGGGTLPSNKSDDVTASFILPFTVNVREEDLWTLEDVGRFLDLVAGKHEAATLKYFPEERDFKFFAKGKPNVVVVPRRDIFHDVLSLYMHSKDLPMPTAEEVLYCHSTTTAEEIRLLWRRAVCDPGYRRIFCLICEHNLSYKIAKEAVQDLRDLMQGHKDFKLVIMCCKEDENSSLLLGDLRDYKKSLPPRPPRKEVMDYIKSHFVNDVVKFGPDLSEVGATVDPDNSYVRVVASGRAGMGKSLYINRLLEEFKEEHASLCQIVPLHGPDVNSDIVAKALRSVEDTPDKPVVYHLDISERITDDIGGILFNMLILRALQDSQGSVWRCKLKNLYAIEVTVPALKEDSGENTEKVISNSVELLQLLPTAKCLSPKECVKLHGTQNQSTTIRLVGMDERKRLEASYQRVYQYLCRREQSVDKFEFNPNTTEGTAVEWIQRIMRFFSLESRDPSWVELYRFTSFLDTQLKASEHSIYCDESIVGDASQGVYGFKSFVVKFMIRMSVDFTVPSLKSAYEDQRDEAAENVDDLEGYQIVERRAWENSVHPYIFFNRNKTNMGAIEYDSMTFIGFNFHLSSKTVNLVSLAGEVLEGNIMPEGLFQWLRGSGVEMRQNPQLWQKTDILKKLFRVFESSLRVDPQESYYKQVDPDDTYALTYDNLVKMLAIQMRFRCGIPVVIMGETGCGKTRLIRYMCQLQAKFKANEGENPRQTFFILKVHGGTTEDTIIKFVKTVQEEARANQEVGLDTVLFFDEANTTDAIGLIKEIMCDKRMKGTPITEDIKFIAACNPYRKHSENMIEKLESAGLGFFIQINETKQKLGATPLRHLVYRVLELPASMKPLVYDYGSLNTDTEKTYIRRIAENHVCTNQLLNAVGGLTDAITRVLSWAQDYMRRREDECSYVSLRDVERCMIVFEWFFCVHKAVSDEMVRVGGMKRECLTDPPTMAMIMSIAVCYGSRLIERDEFEEEVSEQFTAPFVLPNGKETYTSMLQCCQEAFLSNMKLGQNIAHNVALRENVFMMAVCVELRIPLFVVGKPGSSKSLAKSIVAESMQQRESKFLKEKFRTVKLISYQCSQLSTPESIIDVFKSAKNIQNKLGHVSNIALVVLDEVGLAEDSPSLPLKALHPLLEDGTDGSDPRELQIVQREERVAFIGISNWALDPAKMNRGIMVRRGKPDVQELVASARGICSNEVNDPIREYLEPIMENLAQAYLNIVEKQVGKRKEFFGLRDFYSLIKMIYWLIKNNKRDNEEEEVQLTVSQRQLEHAILRNFGGSDEIDPLEEFEDCFTAENFNIVNEPLKDDPDCTRLGLISASLSSKDRSWHGENRYLLFLTENDAALQIMHNYLFQTGVFPDPPHILFGSSFPRDKDYTQICRNINQIKICMETGRPVVLLNLENLYESLYDLLNQYYTEVQDKRYVDLGLQTHRIKCRVHNDFKLILIAEKDKVYEKFPIPLINRLEKHLVMTSTILRDAEAQLCDRVKEWIKCFTAVPGFKAGDAFIGYQPETPAAVVLHASQKIGRPPDGDDSDDQDQWSDRAFACCKYHLIQMACPDALARLKNTPLKEDAEEIWDVYFREQQHLCLSQVIKHYATPEECLPSNESQSSIGPGLLSLESQESFEQSVEDQSPQTDDKEMGLLVQVTTHSQPLAPVDISRLCRELVIEKNTLIHMYLEELDAEADFTDRIKKHFETVKKGDTFVIVQCSSGHLNKDLISCARHKALDELQNFRQTALWENEYVVKQRKIHVIFIVSLPKTPGGSKFIAFQGGKWLCIHLDDLRSPEDSQLGFISAVKTPLSQLVYPGCGPIAIHTRLRFCIQGALAQIPEDQDHASNRKLNLLQTLLELIPENGNADPGEGTFYSVLVRRICTLIEQNESLQTSVTGQEWAVREAMHLHRLQEGGTFTLTLLKRIDKTLTELLAFIVEFVDQNNNLGLCQDEMLGIMWLQIFNNDHLCQLKYEGKSQSVDHGNQSLVQRPGTLGAGRYPCKVPFSWLILSGVEAKWKMFGDIDKSAGDVMRSFSDQIQASYLGQVLESVDSSLLPQLADMYLDDFIAGVVQSSSTNETQVLKRYLQILSEKLLDSEGRESVLSSILTFHVTYHINELQIVQYRELGSIFEELHQLVLDGLSADVDEPLDLLAVNLLLERITPKPVTDKEFWKVQNLRDVYIRKLRECLNIVNGIISKPAPGSNILCAVRQSWQKIQAVEMYISHLIIPLPDNDEVTKGAFRLWHVLSRKAAGFNSKDVIDQCLKILKSVDDCVAKSFGHSDAKMRRLALLKQKSDEKLSDREKAYLKYCNAVKMFFLEMVSVLCFGSGSYEPPQQELIEALMKKVLGEGKTRDLTPLDWEEADANPVIRSVLLQLLLMGRDEDLLTAGKMIEKFIETSSQFLVPTTGKDSSIPVCALVVRCLEDKFSKTFVDIAESSNILRMIEKLSHQLDLSIKIYAGHTPGSPVTFEWLRSIAQLRVCLYLAADLLVCYVKGSPTRELSHRENMMLQQLIQYLSEVLQRAELQEVTLHLTKQIARRHGMTSLTDLYNQGHRFVLPTRFHSDENCTPAQDLLVVCGETYLNLCRSFMQSSVDGSIDSLANVVQALPQGAMYHYVLALFSKVVCPSQLGKSTFSKEMLQGTQELHTRYLDGELLNVCTSVFEGDICGRSTLMRQSQGSSDHILKALILHTITVILTKKNALLEPFQSIILHPSQMEGKYLPTMPEDPLIAAEEAMAFDRNQGYRDNYGKLYQCPNGHPYLIANCTNPNQSFACPYCKAPIGAARDGYGTLAAGNTKIQSDASKEIGYVLGAADTRPETALPERELSPMACAVTRFILHVCYLWSSCHSTEGHLMDLHRTVKLGYENLSTFFLEHVKKDLFVIGKTLSRGEDEVAMLLHEVLHTISQMDATDTDNSLASKSIRKDWEDAFVRKALIPLEMITAVVEGAIDRIRQESEMDMTFMAVHEKTEREAGLAQTLWAYRSRITLQDLGAVLRSTENPREKFPLLDYFLARENTFRALQFLPDVIQLQKVLVSCYIHRSDHDDVMNVSLGAALKKVASTEEEHRILDSYVANTRKAWKLVRSQLPNFPACSVPQEYIKIIGDMSEDVSLTYMLPRESGPGICALALCDYLCLQQNWLLEFCLHQKFSRFSKNTVQVSQLQHFHMVSYEAEIDTVLLTHCRYSLKFGQGQDVEYDLAALQKHIYDRFIVGKPYIDKGTQPMMVFTSDVIRKDVLDQLKEKIKPQISLTSEEQKEVIGRLHHNLTEVSSALQNVTIAMGFLAGDSRPPDMSLGQYISRVLKIKAKVDFCRKYALQHVLSLWETLALDKSRRHSLNGNEVPFDGLTSTIVSKLDSLDPELKTALNDVLKNFNLDLLLSLLFKFIQMWLPSAEDSYFEDPITDFLVAYIDEFEDNNIRDLESRLPLLPGDILLKHAVDVWHTVVKFHSEFEKE